MNTAALDSPPLSQAEAQDKGVGCRDLLGVLDEASKRKSFGGHESPVMGKDEWLTPPEIIRALGDFDLDPSAPEVRPWEMARRHYTWRDNGLLLPWAGRVWLNPPYGTECSKWLGRLAEHGNGCALVFARTETEMWFDHVWPKAAGILFLRGRLHFYHVSGKRADGNAGAPSALIAYGAANVRSLQDSKLPGALWTPNVAVRDAEDRP